MVEHDELGRRWAATWAVAGPALEVVHDRELARLSDADAQAAVRAVLAVAATLPPKPDDLGAGMVQMQRLFRRLHR